MALQRIEDSGVSSLQCSVMKGVGRQYKISDNMSFKTHVRVIVRPVRSTFFPRYLDALQSTNQVEGPEGGAKLSTSAVRSGRIRPVTPHIQHLMEDA